MRFLLILLLSFSFSQQLLSQNKRSKKIIKEYYDSGELKKIAIVKIFERAVYEPGNYYKRTSSWTHEYYPNGTPKSKEFKKTWLGTSGNGCYEIIHKIKMYNEQGKIILDETTECDKGKITNKYYDLNGKLLFVRINYYLLEG